MILNAVKKGVSEERVARAECEHVQHPRQSETC